MSLRLVVAVSLDGRLAPPDGGAAQLGGVGDRRVLEDSLAWADACLLGAGTLRAHGSTCQIRRSDLLAERESAHRPSQPLAVVVSRSNPPPGLDPGWLFWRQPMQRWLAAPAGPEATPPVGFEQLLPLRGWSQLLTDLRSSGLERLVLLGGAQLAGQLLQADLVDELQLTLCPLVLGGPYTWLPDVSRPEPQRWSLLDQQPLGGGELLLRYQRSGNS